MKSAFFLTAIGVLACTGCGQKERQAPLNQQPPQENTFNYNPKNVANYRGQILQILDIFDPSTQSNTVGILMQTEKGIIPVILGPRCYTSGGPGFNPGQQIEVNGSEVNMDGSVIIIASDAKMEGYTLKLRNRDGSPLWSGWHKN